MDSLKQTQGEKQRRPISTVAEMVERETSTCSSILLYAVSIAVRVSLCRLLKIIF